MSCLHPTCSGNFIIIVGTTLALVALTWGGIRYPWNSVHVLAPLIIGFFLILLFFVYEALVPKQPTLPLDILSNRTSLSGCVELREHFGIWSLTPPASNRYISTFFHGITSIAIICMHLSCLVQLNMLILPS